MLQLNFTMEGEKNMLRVKSNNVGKDSEVIPWMIHEEHLNLTAIGKVGKICTPSLLC